MFRKRQKKQFPPGTFIPTPARICAIIQLCLAFSLLLWNASEPFVGEIFTLKSRQIFYQEIMGIPTNDKIDFEKQERLARNAERFKSLPRETRTELIHNYQLIQKQLQRSFFEKMKSVIDLFIIKISPYELAWITFSIVISIMLLKRVEGASQAVWLLPLLTALYAADSRLFPTSNSGSLDAKLFPSENELIEHYVKEPLSKDIFEQQIQMKEGWKRYLVINWTKLPISEDPFTLDKQAEEGEFNFTLARLKTRAKQDDFFDISKNKSQPPAYAMLILYFFWNTYFAYTASKNMKIYKKQSLNI